MLSKRNGKFDDERFSLNKVGKGVFPYSMVKSCDTLFNTKKYPDHNAFFSDLTQTNVDIETYNHGKRSWDVFGCRNLGKK